MPYPEEMVQPMRAEATAAGAAELRTADQVRASMAQHEGASLYFINSVCGCSAAFSCGVELSPGKLLMR